jgi:4-nitrophenyl phosphatase
MKPIPVLIRERINRTCLFIFDLDGTVYLGDRLIPGAGEFISALRRRNIPYVFLTNNSSRSARYYRKKIGHLGIPVTRDNVFTSGQATGMYLARKKSGARVFVLGTRSLSAELASYGLVPSDGKDSVDFVVAGFDMELTYEKLRRACALIDGGAGYIATNPDYVCPIGPGRSIPDCGSICFMIEQATGKKPYVIGKPRPDMIRFLCRKFSVTANRTAMIGDRLYTDIAAGKNAGALAICVLTGEATAKTIARARIKPDVVMNSLGDLNDLLLPLSP